MTNQQVMSRMTNQEMAEKVAKLLAKFAREFERLVVLHKRLLAELEALNLPNGWTDEKIERKLYAIDLRIEEARRFFD